jgi:hypothetical protein
MLQYRRMLAVTAVFAATGSVLNWLAMTSDLFLNPLDYLYY